MLIHSPISLLCVSGAEPNFGLASWESCCSLKAHQMCASASYSGSTKSHSRTKRTWPRPAISSDHCKLSVTIALLLHGSSLKLVAAQVKKSGDRQNEWNSELRRVEVNRGDLKDTR